MPRLSRLRVALSLVCFIIATGVGKAQPPDPKLPRNERKRPKFSQGSLNPPELQFGCFGASDPEEQKLAKLLADGEPHRQLAAAKTLWEGHSRRQAANVIKYLAGPPPGGDGYRKLQREIDAALKPQAILRELTEGDYLWGTWLAFLRPHEDAVPTLLAGLKDKPPRDLLAKGTGKSKFFHETMLALGNSGDARAREPLLELLKGDNSWIAGDAANALGYLGDTGVEPKLIEALGGDVGWLQLRACMALAKLGSRKALPALEKLAEDERYTGALNVRGMAEDAIQRILERDKR